VRKFAEDGLANLDEKTRRLVELHLALDARMQELADGAAADSPEELYLERLDAGLEQLQSALGEDLQGLVRVLDDSAEDLRAENDAGTADARTSDAQRSALLTDHVRRLVQSLRAR
jgi:hypothetical protein